MKINKSKPKLNKIYYEKSGRNYNILLLRNLVRLLQTINIFSVTWGKFNR